MSLARRLAQRDHAWITATDKTAAIKASRVPQGIRVAIHTAENPKAHITLTPSQAQALTSQIRNESRKRT